MRYRVCRLGRTNCLFVKPCFRVFVLRKIGSLRTASLRHGNMRVISAYMKSMHLGSHPTCFLDFRNRHHRGSTPEIPALAEEFSTTTTNRQTPLRSPLIPTHNLKLHLRTSKSPITHHPTQRPRLQYHSPRIIKPGLWKVQRPRQAQTPGSFSHPPI